VTQPLHHNPQLDRLVSELFGPICRDYAIVADRLGAPGNFGDPISSTPLAILRENPDCFLPDLEGAFDALLRSRILSHGEERGTYRWGKRAEEIHEFKHKCALPGMPAAAGRH